MTMEYLLPCECGQKITVAAGQAGQDVTCQCGKTSHVPPLRKLAELDRVVKTETGNRNWSSAQRVAFVTIASIAVVLMTSLAYLVAGSSSTGPAAALLLERGYRGKLQGTLDEPYFPSGRPIPFKEMKNIKPLTRTLWSRPDVEADFVAYRESLRGEDPKAAGQLKGIMVIVKTERCQQRFRSCATATAALEKQSSSLLKHFRIYGAWIESNPDHRGSDWKEWEQQVIHEYDFKLGPGPKIWIFFPGQEKKYEADAKQLDLYLDPFEKRKGKTPMLEQFLVETLADAGVTR